MTVILPSIGAQAGEALAPIAAALENYIQPQKKFQNAVLSAISQDPSLIQKFADMEAQQPGMLQKLGIPGLQGTPSADAQFAVENRPDIIDAKKQALKNTQIELQNKGRIDSMMAKVLADETTPDPIRKAIISQGFGIKTPDELKIDTEHARQMALGTLTAEAKAPAEIAKAGVEAKKAGMEFDALTEAQNLITAGGPISFEKILGVDAQGNSVSKYTPLQMQGLIQSDLWPFIKAQLDTYDTQLRIKASESGDERAYKLLNQREAFGLFEKVGVAAPLDTYNKYLFGGGAQRAKELIGQDISKLSQEDQDLVRIQSRVGQDYAADINKSIIQSVNAFNATFIHPLTNGKNGDPQRRILAGQITNQLGAQAAALNIQPYSFEYKEQKRLGGFLPSTRSYVFKDINGQEVPEDQALNGVPVVKLNKTFIGPPNPNNPQTQSSTETPKTTATFNLGRAVSTYNTLSPGEKQAALARWKGEMDAKDYQAFLKAIGEK